MKASVAFDGGGVDEINVAPGVVAEVVLEQVLQAVVSIPPAT